MAQRVRADRAGLTRQRFAIAAEHYKQVNVQAVMPLAGEIGLRGPILDAVEGRLVLIVCSTPPRF